jgi:hypothetical protein
MNTSVGMTNLWDELTRDAIQAVAHRAGVASPALTACHNSRNILCWLRVPGTVR